MNENDDLQFVDLLEEEQEEKETTFETKEVKQKKSRKPLVAYLVYLFVLLAAAGIFLVYARSVIKEYDELHPDTYLEKVVEELSTNGFSEEGLAAIAVGPFDDADELYEAVNASVLGKELSTKFRSEDFNTNTLKYYIYADGEKVSEASLTAEDSFTKLHVFQMSHYQVDSYNPPVDVERKEAIRIVVPEDYKLYLNGKLVGAEYQKELSDVQELAYCAAYVENLPKLATYEVDDIYRVKEVRVEDAYGTEKYAWVKEENNQVADEQAYVVDAALSYEESEPSEEFKITVFQMVKDYADFFSGDLPGCAESVQCIRYMFPADSMYLTLADQYRREERRNFTSHTDNHYTEEMMDGYVQYGENLVVCHVTMKKHMNVWGKQVIDPIDTIYYLVKVDGRWLIADMQ